MELMGRTTWWTVRTRGILLIRSGCSGGFEDLHGFRSFELERRAAGRCLFLVFARSGGEMWSRNLSVGAGDGVCWCLMLLTPRTVSRSEGFL